jgi:fermentation-respiration switch protein FrsA (DUF1100 family)
MVKRLERLRYKIAPRPILFITSDNDRLVPPAESEALYARAGEPKKLVMLNGYHHYEVYEGEAFREVMAATTDWSPDTFQPKNTSAAAFDCRGQPGARNRRYQTVDL